MSIILDLEPELERGLLARAAAKGVSLADYAHEILAREVGVPEEVSSKPPASEAKNLVELFAPVRGLLTDDEIDLYFSRDRSTSRPVDLG